MEVVVVLKTCVGLLVVALIVSVVQLYRLLEERAALLVELERLERSHDRLRDLRRQYRQYNDELMMCHPNSAKYKRAKARVIELKKWIEDILRGSE